MDKTRIDLPILLPEIPDAKDACVERLTSALESKAGVQKVHIVTNDNKSLLCLHTDPKIISVKEITSLATSLGAEISHKFGHGVFPLSKIDSEDAAPRLEQRILEISGVVSASVNLPAQVARIEWDCTKISGEQVKSLVDKILQSSVETKSLGIFGKYKEMSLSGIAGLLLFLGWSTSTLIPHAITLIIYLASYIFGAWDLVGHSVEHLRKGKFKFDIDLLMLVAAIGAATLGEWAEGALLLFLFSAAHALEHLALAKARNAIKALGDLAPAKAKVKKNGQEVEVPVAEVKPGDIVVILPGEKIPVDGKLRVGNSAVNQAPITGESVPVDKKVEDEVFAGSINGEGALEVEATKAGTDRTLDRIIKLVQEAQTQKAPTAIFTERFERIFVPTVLVLALLAIALPPMFLDWSFHESFYRAMALLVGASPCALALGTPSAVLSGIAQAARNGILIKGGAYLENFGTLKAFAFDKTGTLTVGKPSVTDVIPGEGISEEELLKIAGAVERRSQHPLAKAVTELVSSKSIAMPEAGELQSTTGKGVTSSVNGATAQIGSLKMWSDVEVPKQIQDSVKSLQDGGKSVMVVKHGSKWLGVLGLSDSLRPDAKEILNQLRNLGLSPLVMLTGDNAGIGNAVAKNVGVDEVRADLLPEDKVTALKDLLSKHGQVAMLGDGVNDAPALAHATVGVAMGGAGTAVALETADIALMGDDLSKLPFAVGLSRSCRSVIKQNLYLSLSVIAFLMIFSLTGIVGIGPAVIVHEGSTMVVIANSLRLLAYRRNEKPGQ